ncbi:lactoylglutathione lyase [Litoreibacter meonggei]|uniref:lactoylglutathione lyase n=1 Tax=Litoreibacter meonggei TaxID=1049199 RepID=A0A497VSI7_9RHOB|nr:lactoylglutathione lyase [Litoreibacter meonggei]RLJ41019.1 lactoylglutathione lyase [Litoreibacter meonggei]
MNTNLNATKTPHAILYTMIRVQDLDRSLRFYCDALGMREVRRETFTDAEFTLVFVGYPDSDALIELTNNWGDNSYFHGTGYGHIALEVHDIHQVCTDLSKQGVEIVRAPGPMKMASDETGEREIIAFVKDPDGYRIELIQAS